MQKMILKVLSVGVLIASASGFATMAVDCVADCQEVAGHAKKVCENYQSTSYPVDCLKIAKNVLAACKKGCPQL